MGQRREERWDDEERRPNRVWGFAKGIGLGGAFVGGGAVLASLVTPLPRHLPGVGAVEIVMGQPATPGDATAASARLAELDRLRREKVGSDPGSDARTEPPSVAPSVAAAVPPTAALANDVVAKAADAGSVPAPTPAARPEQQTDAGPLGDDGTAASDAEKTTLAAVNVVPPMAAARHGDAVAADAPLVRPTETRPVDAAIAGGAGPNVATAELPLLASLGSSADTVPGVLRSDIRPDIMASGFSSIDGLVTPAVSLPSVTHPSPVRSGGAVPMPLVRLPRGGAAPLAVPAKDPFVSTPLLPVRLRNAVAPSKVGLGTVPRAIEPEPEAVPLLISAGSQVDDDRRLEDAELAQQRTGVVAKAVPENDPVDLGSVSLAQPLQAFSTDAGLADALPVVPQEAGPHPTTEAPAGLSADGPAFGGTKVASHDAEAPAIGGLLTRQDDEIQPYGASDATRLAAVGAPDQPVAISREPLSPAAQKAPTGTPEIPEERLAAIADEQVSLALPGPALEINARLFDPPQNAKLMSVILRDAGGGGMPVEALNWMTMPLTLTIRPGAASRRFAEQGRAAGHEILAELPMITARTAVGGAGLDQDMEPEALVRRTAGMLAGLDVAIGVTAPPDAPLLRDRSGMRAILAPVVKHGFAWIDQKARIGSQAAALAKRGAPAWASGDRWIADGASERQVYQSLQTAAFHARRQGEVIVFLPTSQDALKAIIRWGLERGGQEVWFAPLSAVLSRRNGG